MEAEFLKLCRGTLPLEDLAKLCPKTITFFLISSFSDFEEERDVLRNVACPRLKEYFRNTYGIVFEYIDINLGLDDVGYDASDYWDLFHDSKRKYALASQNCVPVILLGQKFGLPILPKRLPSRVFYLIRSTLRAHRNSISFVYSILDEWYQLDTNADRTDGDSEHVLISAKILYPDIISSNDQLKALAVQKWKAGTGCVATLLKVGVGICLKEATLDDQSAFEILVFELDAGVSHVLAHSDFCQYHPIVFEREIIDLKNYLNEIKAESFIDIQRDKESGATFADVSLNELLQDLNDRVTSVTNIDRKFSVLWRFPDGINKNMHQAYLGDFCEAFIDSAKFAVERRMTLGRNLTDKDVLNILDPAWTSLQQCNVLAPFCMEQTETINAIVTYCTRPLLSQQCSPIVLAGTTGYGVMETLAKAVLQTQKKFQELASNSDNQSISLKEWASTALLIVRMVTSEQRVPDLVESIFEQVKACFPILENEPAPKTMLELVLCIRKVNVVLFVGGAERLVNEYRNQVKLSDIIPLDLSVNTRLVMTCLPNEEFSNETQLNILEITENTRSIRDMLKRAGRNIGDSQAKHCELLFANVPDVLSASLLFDALSKIKSYDNIDRLPNCTSDLITFSFTQLEEQFGSSLVQHAFCFISLSLNGLTDSEIVDILSLDDIVLDELRVPIKDGTRRFPSSLWQIIKQNISLFIRVVCLDGFFLVILANDAVIEAVKQKYLLNEDLVKSMHYLMADYFLGTWYSISKPISTAESATEISTANRLMPSQKLVYGDGIHKFYNQRVLRQLPHHLFRSDRIIELNNMVLFNYNWLFCKSSALGLKATIAEFSLVQNIEVSLVEETIRKAESILSNNLNNLASELSGNLVTYSYLYKNIKNLVRQADVYGCSHNIFIPTYSYPKLPGSALQSTIRCPSQVQSMQQHHGILYIKLQSDPVLYKYDLESNKMIAEIRMSCGAMHLSTDQQVAVVIDEPNMNSMRIHRVDDGSYTGHILPLNWIDAIPFEEKNMFRISKIKVSREILSCIISSRASYVIIASIYTCQPVHVFKPEHRATLCDITPNERFILTNNGEQVLVFEVGNGVQTSAVDLLAFPKKLIFTQDGTKAFILCEGEQKVVILFIDSKGAIEMSYKIMFESTVPSDRLQDMKISQNEELLLVRAEKNVIVYEFQRDAIVAHIRRPLEIPFEFKMPNSNYEDISFSEANFAFDDRVVITAIFRDVLVWEVSDAKPLVMLHAPAGILSQLIVEPQQNMLIGYIGLSKEIHIWSLQGAFTDGTVIDSLTSSVKSIHTSRLQEKAVACCNLSDEMGVYDLNTGFLTDLYSHEGVVISCVISSCGTIAVATVRQRIPDTTNIIWSLSERKIVAEFGNVPGYLIACVNSSDIYIVHQNKIKYRQPYEVSRVKINENRDVHVENCSFVFPFLIGVPFITADERWLVGLVPSNLDDSNAFYILPQIMLWDLHNEQKTIIGPNMLCVFDLVQSILDIRPCLTSCIAIMYSQQDYRSDFLKNEFGSFGIMIIDVNDFSVRNLAGNLFEKATQAPRVVISNSGLFCIDVTCNALYSIEVPNLVQHVAPESYYFRCFAKRDSLMVFTNFSSVYAFRLPECTLAGQLDVHSSINTVKVHNDQYILVGTDSGNVLSFLIVDNINQETVLEAVQGIPSRESKDGERTQSWDRNLKSPHVITTTSGPH